MKLLDIINESDNEKIIKKTKTIYKGLKKGVVKKGHFGDICYIMPDEYDIDIDIHGEAFIKVGGRKSYNEIKYYYRDNGSGEVRNYDLTGGEYTSFFRTLSKRFDHFNITLYFMDTITETITESVEPPSEKDIKRARAILKALKRGRIQKNPIVGDLYYELPDKFEVVGRHLIPTNRDKDSLYVAVGHDGQINSIHYYRKKDNEFVRESYSPDHYRNILLWVNKKFEDFGIRLVFMNRSGHWAD